MNLCKVIPFDVYRNTAHRIKLYDTYLINVTVMFTAITPEGKTKISLLTFRVLLITLTLVNLNMTAKFPYYPPLFSNI
jgi:hypothetical protein